MFSPDSLVLAGRFRILRPLAQGGMGDVYLAEQVSLGRRVALKVLRQDLRLQAGMAERFEREARLLSSVDHPAVVRVIDYGQEEEASFLVMEYAEGRTLASALASGPLPPPRGVALLAQLAEGLAAIHAAGIVHRDLKPENVVLVAGPTGEQAKLLDFGIARLAEAHADSNLSQAGVVLGTPEYLSPEQATGARVDFRSDLYSLGLLAYRCLSGVLPFPGPSPRAYLAQHVGTLPTPLATALPALGTYPVLCSLVMRCLEKDPVRRPTSARAVVEALRDPALLTRASRPVALPGALPGPAALEATSAGAAAEALFAGELLLAEPPEDRPAPPITSRTHAYGTPAAGTLAFGAADAAAAEPLWAALPPGEDWGQGVSAPPPPVPTWPAADSFGALRPSPTAQVGRVQNLTVMLTDIAGFTATTSMQTREENARLLDTHDRLLLPLVRRHGGRLVQKRGDALLVSFTSPTNAVLCGMAIQDRLWRHNARPAGEPVVRVRVVIHLGDVLVDEDTLVGEPLEVLELVEKQAGAGEVLFTEAVNLARNRAEASAEERGAVALSSGQQLRLYRCTPAAEGAPFGGRDRPPRTPLQQRLEPVVDRARAVGGRLVAGATGAGQRGAALLRFLLTRGAALLAALVAAVRTRGGAGLTRLGSASGSGLARLRSEGGSQLARLGSEGGSRLAALRSRGGAGLVALRARAAARLGEARAWAASLPPPMRWAVLAGTVGVLLAAVGGGLWYQSTGPRVRRLMEAERRQEALALLDGAVRDGAGPWARTLRAQVLHALGRHREELAELRGLGEEERKAVDEEVLRGLAEDFGRSERNAALRELLAALPARTVDGALGELAAEEEPSLRQWGALRFLDSAERAGALDLVEHYTRALEMKECHVRAAAARRLGELGDMKALAPLTRLREATSDRACGQEEAAAALRALERKASR